MWWPLSPARVEQRDCRSFPTSSAWSDWCWVPRFPLSLSGLWATWMRREQVCGSVELTSWPMTGRREELRESEEGIEKREGGILCNGVENTKERRTHAFVIFVVLHPPAPLHPFPSLVPCLPFLFSFLCITFRVKWCQQMLCNKCPFNCCFVRFYTCFNNKWKALMIMNNLKAFSCLQNNHFWRSN